MALGCYIPQYYTASYKGVVFDAMEVSSEHGRRGAEGEFPFGESTAYADLGRRIRTYSLRGRFPGNDHVARAGLLIAACEAPGPGLLVHPTRGPVTVACRSVKVTDNPLEEQGVTYIDLDMVEASLWGSGFSFGSAFFGIVLDTVLAVATATFQRDYTPQNVRYFRKDQVLATAGAGIGVIRDEFVKASQPVADIKVWRAAADFDTITQDSVQLSKEPVVEQAVTLGLSATDRYSAPADKFNRFRRIANWGAKSSTLISTAGVSENAIYSFIRTLAAGYMARGATEVEPTTMTEAFKQYDQVIAILDDEIEIARLKCDNLLFLALREFETTVQAAMLNRAYNLPTLIEYRFANVQHSQAAAYEIFNDAKRFVEIEQRNPGALPWMVGPGVIAARV